MLLFIELLLEYGDWEPKGDGMKAPLLSFSWDIILLAYIQAPLDIKCTAFFSRRQE